MEGPVWIVALARGEEEPARTAVRVHVVDTGLPLLVRGPGEDAVDDAPEKESCLPPRTSSVSVPSEFSTTSSSGPRYEGSPRLMSSFEPSLDHARGTAGPRSLSWIRSDGEPPDVGFTAQIPSLFPNAIQPRTSAKIPSSAGVGVGVGSSASTWPVGGRLGDSPEPRPRSHAASSATDSATAIQRCFITGTVYAEIAVVAVLGVTTWRVRPPWPIPWVYA